MRSGFLELINIKHMNKSKTPKVKKTNPTRPKQSRIKQATKKDLVIEAVLVEPADQSSTSDAEQTLSLEATLEKLFQSTSNDNVHLHLDEIADPKQQLNVMSESDSISDWNTTESQVATDEVTDDWIEVDNELDVDHDRVIVYPVEVEAQHQAIIQAALYLAGANGVNIHDLKRVLYQWETNSEYLHGLIKRMNGACLNDDRTGLVIAKFDDRYKLITKPELKPFLSKIIRLQLRSALTPSLLEVLAIVAYNNPCTKGLIHKIRQIDPTNSIEKLMRLGLVSKHKRAQTPGNPWLYKLTDKFFDLFGIKSTQQLPKVSVVLDESFEHTDESVDFFDVNRPDDVNEELG